MGGGEEERIGEGDEERDKNSHDKTTEYRLKPVFGFIDAGSNATVEVTRLAGPPKENKLVIQYAPAPEGAADASKAWAGVSPAGDVVVTIKAE